MTTDDYRLTVYAELDEDADQGDEQRPAVAHVAAGMAELTLCRLPVRRLVRCSDLVFSPCPAGLTRCAGCLTAYAVLPSTQTE